MHLAFFPGEVSLRLGATLHDDGNANTTGSVQVKGRQVAELRRNLSEAALQPPQVVSCTVADHTRGRTAGVNSVVLSAKQLSTTLQCGTGATAVPVLLTDVCYPPDQENVEACKAAGTNLRELLQATNKVTWTTTTLPEPSEKRDSRTLELTLDDLPYSDTTFFAGCRSTEREKQTCKVDITVLARSSSVDRNVVACAYGAESNPRALKVQMTEENNTLTIKCGKDGTIQPANYKDRYCEDEKLSPCSRSYKDILPRFDSPWWTKEGETAAPVLKLTVPREDFPVEDQTFYVGCTTNAKNVAEKASGDSGAGDEEGKNPGNVPRLARW
ncbi:SAG-related sequence [Besnoitia besnoiti]|uniref:SAG-related sequence n=1 Tax=Besnoitia besnoiti TaxID=94643 RepID=A0A2A9MLV4_BESBE|nr:SAG-related sequence [Besnoitia besnoiti]PFH37036.1 SAG-related sequence [Besnoitia besnoiti]